MSKRPHSPAVDQPWLFAESFVSVGTGQTVRVLRQVDRTAADKILEARKKAAAGGKVGLAAPPMFYCEMKPTLTIREAASDLRCSDSQVYALIDTGKLRTFAINDAHKNIKKFAQRVLSESVAALINEEIRS